MKAGESSTPPPLRRGVKFGNVRADLRRLVESPRRSDRALLGTVLAEGSLLLDDVVRVTTRADPHQLLRRVQVMREHHLSYAARAWIGRSAKEPPTLLLSQLVVKGKVRAWKVEVEPIKPSHTGVS